MTRLRGALEKYFFGRLRGFMRRVHNLQFQLKQVGYIARRANAELALPSILNLNLELLTCTCLKKI